MFNNFIMQPMRKGEKIIDHICSNIPSDIDYTNVILCPSRSAHDAPYIIEFLNDLMISKHYYFSRYMTSMKQKNN